MGKPLLYIETRISKRKIKDLTLLLESINKNKINQEVGIKVLDVYQHMVNTPISITNCTFTNK